MWNLSWLLGKDGSSLVGSKVGVHELITGARQGGQERASAFYKHYLTAAVYRRRAHTTKHICLV